MNSWNLFLDDERDSSYVDPSGDTEWKVARSTAEAIRLVTKLGLPKYMSLDHDLGDDDDSMKFLKWLVWTYGAYLHTPPEYSIHSANPVGAKNIDAFMRSWKKSQNVSS